MVMQFGSHWQTLRWSILCWRSQPPTAVEEVNALLRSAAEGPQLSILGYEERPLVSVDYQTDPRSSIIDALSTMVIDHTQVKLYA